MQPLQKDCAAPIETVPGMKCGEITFQPLCVKASVSKSRSV
jgi:hypothetical protein